MAYLLVLCQSSALAPMPLRFVLFFSANIAVEPIQRIFHVKIPWIDSGGGGRWKSIHRSRRHRRALSR